MRRSLRGLLVLMLMLATAGAGVVNLVEARSAQASGSIEIHARLCDTIPVDGNWYGACHDSLAEGVYFDAIETTSGEVVSGTTGANGNLLLNLPAGTWQLFGPPGEFVEETFIYCSTGAGTPEVPHPVTIGDGTAIVCDYYFVPADLSGLGSIEIHGRICDAIPADGDWFTACHDDLAVDVHFDAINQETGAVVSGRTDASGSVALRLEPGTWQLSGPPGDFLAATFIYCSTGEGTPEVAHPVELASGQNVICDYYVVPEDQSGRTPTPVPTATVAPTVAPQPTTAPTAVPREAVLELPVILVAGSCEDVMNATEIVAELSDAVILTGEAEGSADALQAAVGYTRVNVPLDTMLASDHVIAVLDEESESVVACGAIGGVGDSQGAFTIGLAPVDDSGVAGTAYLAARGSATGISVFIIPDGLMPDPVLEPVG